MKYETIWQHQKDVYIFGLILLLVQKKGKYLSDYHKILPIVASK